MDLLKKNKSYFFLFFIILLQILILIYYINIKTIPYYDEIWTYGLANSKNKPFLYDSVYTLFGDSDGADLLYNRWVSGDYYFKYITVQPEDCFDFKNVYDNQTLDLHPPLYYYLLHFVCSFFPNSFSLWYGYVINILFLIITQIVLFKLGLIISNNEKFALINCLFFSLSMGAVNEFICIRMYGALSFFFISMSYLAIDICIKETITQKDFYKIIIISFLGFLTDNQFYYYVFALSLSCLIYFLFRRNYRLIIEYLLTVIISLLLFWNYFPWIFIQIQRFDKPPWQTSNFLLKPLPLKEILGNFSIMNNYIWGLDTSYQLNIFKYVWHYFNNCVNYIPVWLLLVGLVFLLYYFFVNKKWNFKWLIFLFTFIIYHVLLASNTFYNRSLFFFGIYTFSILPCFAIVFLNSYYILITNFISWNKLRNFLLVSGISIFILFSHYNSDRLWCCNLQPGTEKMCEYLKDKNVFYIVDSNVLVDIIIQSKPWEFMKAKNVFASRSHNLNKIIKAVNNLPKNDEFIIIIPNSQKGKNVYSKIIELDNCKIITFIGVNEVQACSFLIFKMIT